MKTSKDYDIVRNPLEPNYLLCNGDPLGDEQVRCAGKGWKDLITRDCKIVGLEMRNCGLNRVPLGLLDFDHLRTLYLSGNPIDDVETLYDIPSLRIVDMSGTDISSNDCLHIEEEMIRRNGKAYC